MPGGSSGIDQGAPGVLGGGKGAGVHPGVTSCAIFSSSLVTKLLWFLSPELSAELSQRQELILLALRLSGSLLTTTLSFSPVYSDPQAHVLLSQGEGMCFSPIFKPWKWLGQIKLHLPHKHKCRMKASCPTTTSEAQHFCSGRQRASQDGMTFPYRPPQVPQDTDPGSWGEPRRKSILHPGDRKMPFSTAHTVDQKCLK